jgi:signal peptidase I
VRRRRAAALENMTSLPAGERKTRADEALREPIVIEYARSFFPVLLLILVFRSFLAEPFKIPSGSMVPTLLIGDLILVNKYHYGVRLPVINKKIIEINDPQRGDVMVFRYPANPSVDYIKRVVGVPGDEVAYLNQKLYLNGKLTETQPLPEFYDDESTRYFKQYSEKLGLVEHRILVDVQRPSYIRPTDPFPFKENCRYSAEGVTCKVPAGHYFMMGDNRDNSEDSRFWGFVPDQNIVGKAFFVWMNFGNLGRIGSFH